MRCLRGLDGSDSLLLPHPVVAPIALPAGQSAVAELQIEPVPVRKQTAAAGVAEREEDFVARAASDIIEGRAERACGIFRVHAEYQRDVVRQRRGEGRRVGAADRRQSLRMYRSNCAAGQGNHRQCRREQFLHDAAFRAVRASRPPRNGNTASMNACGWSMLTAWPAGGLTTFRAAGILAAMWSEADRNGELAAPARVSRGTLTSG